MFALKTGEQMSLSEEQYVLLDGGLVLVVDELAQDAMAELPVMGSLRTQLLTEIEPVRSPDGSIIEVSSTQPLWSGNGPTPRLFEDVDLKTYEVAQSSVGDTNTAGDALATSMSVAPGAMALLGMLMTSDQPEAETPAPPAPPTPAPPSAPEFWTDDDVANSASTAITGSNGDSFVGYTAASTSATPDPLTSIGVGSTATFDMSAGGNNKFAARSSAGYNGVLSYTGGSGDDSLTFSGIYLAAGNGSATFDMSLGGDNTFVAGSSAAYSSGLISYTGGSGNDSLTFGDYLAMDGATATFDMSAGGDNTFVAGSAAAVSSGAIVYKGGNGIDTLTFGSDAALTGGSIDIRLGADAAADKVTFQGSIGGSGGTVTIKNFNYNDDTIDVAAGVSAVGGEIADAGGNLTWTDSGGSHTIVFKGIGTGGTGVVATSAQLAADII